MVWGFVILGVIVVLFVGGFAILGGFAAASFTKAIIAGVLAIAGGTFGGDRIATEVLMEERPEVVQDSLEDLGIDEPCSWEDEIEGTWDLTYIGGEAFESGGRAYLSFKSRNRFKLVLQQNMHDANDLKVEGKYGCGPDDRLLLEMKLDQRALEEELGDIPNVKLGFTLEYNVEELTDDRLSLSLYNAYFGTGITKLATFFLRDADQPAREEGYGCDLTDVKCWNGAVYYLFKEYMPYMKFER